jgi:hypothetical protein
MRFFKRFSMYFRSMRSMYFSHQILPFSKIGDQQESQTKFYFLFSLIFEKTTP